MDASDLLLSLTMIRPYTGLPLDTPDPGLPGVKTMWIPMLRIRVSAKHQSTPTLPAIVDSGSPYCLFRTDVADFLKINLGGAPKGSLGGVIKGASDPVLYYPVSLTIEANWTINVLAGFTKKLSVQAILGRGGFFDRFQVRFDHSKKPHEFEITKIDLIN